MSIRGFVERSRCRHAEAVLLGAAILGALAGSVSAGGGGGPTPGSGIKCPETSACGAAICGGTTGCHCDTSSPGNPVCLQN